MKRKIVVFISMALAIVMLAFGLTACGTNDEKTTAESVKDVASENVDDGEAIDSLKEVANESEAVNDEDADISEEDEDADVTNDVEDVVNNDVAFGDTNAQKKLSDAIQNGEMLDKTVTIDGVSREIGSRHSIGQLEDGKFLGTAYTMEGDYPEDGAHVVITGNVVQDGYSFIISAVSVDVLEDIDTVDSSNEEAADAEESVNAEEAEEPDKSENVSKTDKNDMKNAFVKNLKAESQENSVTNVNSDETTVTVTPSDKRATTNEKFSFTVETGELAVDSYEWQMFSNNEWRTIKNNKSASTDTLDIATPSKMIDGYKYRCVITLEDGSEVISEEAVISVE